MKLNKIEKLKLHLTPAQYYERLDEIREDDITDADRFYLKNFGIYNAKTKSDFMLRLRIPAGRISQEQLEIIVQEVKRYKATMLLTSRAQMELHHLRLKEAIALHKLLIRNNLTTFGTLVDNFRNIVSDVFDGVARENRIEVYPLILQMQEKVLQPHILGMIPRKFNTAIVGSSSCDQSFFGNDCYFALAKKDEKVGFNLYLGGKNSDLAKSAGIFVKKEDVVELFYAIAQAYHRYGLRQNRTKARLYHLLEAIGMEEFKKKIREFYSKPFEEAGEAFLAKKEIQDWTQLKDGRYAYRHCTDFGQISYEEMEELVDLAKTKSLEIRFGTDQNIYLLGFEKPGVRMDNIGPRMLVCAGSRYCIFSLFDTKEEAKSLKKEDLEGIKIGYSGCLKGCARHILADIGLVGIRTNAYQRVERGVRFFLGGLYTKGEMAARLIFWAVPLRCLQACIAVVIDQFRKSGYEDFEDFSRYVLALYESEFLAWYILTSLKGEELEPLGSIAPRLIEKSELQELERSLFSKDSC